MDRRARTSTWYGLNRTPFINDGELRNMKNIVGEAFPYLKSRGKKQEFKFSVAVPGVAGDGYIADVTKMPEPSAKNEGDIYKYTPPSNVYTAGAIYRYSSGAWNVAYSNIWGYLGSLGNYDENLTVDENLDRKIIEYRSLSEQDYAANAITRQNGIFYKCAAIFMGYAYYPTTRTNYYYSADKTTNTALPTPSESINNERYYYTGADNAPVAENIIMDDNGNWVHVMKANMNYYCKPWYTLKWVRTDSGYTAVTNLPESAPENTLFRFCGESVPCTNTYHTAETDIADGKQIYFVAAGTRYNNPEKTAQSVKKLPKVSGENLFNVYYYTGVDMTAAKYLKCVYENKDWYWTECERPNVAKSLTLREYIDGYKDITLKRVLDIHEHLGEMAVMFSDNAGGVYLLYDGEIYNIPTMGSESNVKMVSCGEKMFLGESGAVFDADKREISTVGGKFNFEIPCDIIQLGDRIKESTFTDGHLYCVSQDSALLKKVAAAANVNGLSVKLSYKKQEYSATVISASVTDTELGQKTASGEWMILKYSILKILFKENITIENVWKNYLYIKTVGLTDVTAWKNRLWGYEKDALRGTALEIFNSGGGIDWTLAENTEKDAVRRKMWQGGEINAICSTASGVMCFHRNYIDVIRGNTKSTLYAQQLRAPGIASINKKSLAVYGDYAYYLSYDGVYRTSGTSTTSLSEKEKIEGTAATAIASRDRYYLSVKTADGGKLYVYDMRRDMWHIADETHVQAFAEMGGTVYMADGDKIYSFSEDSGNVEFMIEAEYDEETWQKKKYKEIDIGAKLSDATVEICTESGRKVKLAHIKNKNGSIRIPLPNAVICEKLIIRITGRGDCELRSAERVFELI